MSNRLRYTKKLTDARLKITPQRLAVLEALLTRKDHPTAERICDLIQASHPNIATGTVYKTLETFVQRGLIRKVGTDRDVMRYDAITEPHHHLYCAKSDRIADYTDPELQEMIEHYFKQHEIPGFTIADIRLQIIGEFSAVFRPER